MTRPTAYGLVTTILNGTNSLIFGCLLTFLGVKKLFQQSTPCFGRSSGLLLPVLVNFSQRSQRLPISLQSMPNPMLFLYHTGTS